MFSGLPDVRGAYMVSLDGGAPLKLLSTDTAALYASGYLLRAADGALVAVRLDLDDARVGNEPVVVGDGVGQDDGLFHSAFSVSESGVVAHRGGTAAIRDLAWVDREGVVSTVVSDDGSPANPEVSPDGRRVTLNRVANGNIDVWLLDTDRGVTTRFTFDGATDTRPIWSPDGSQIVFASNRRGPADLYTKPTSGATDERQLLTTEERKSPLDWSRDGRFVLYSSQGAATQSDLWVLPMTGEPTPSPFVRTPFDEIEGQFSPDARWIAYASNESGAYEIYGQAFPASGAKWQVSTSGGLHPRWSADGRELYYLAPDNQLIAVTVRASTDGRTLDAAAPAALFSSRVVTSGGNVIAGASNARAQDDVTADGRFLMNLAADQASSIPISVILNWTSLTR